MSFSDNISEEDKMRVRDIRNRPQYESGFESNNLSNDNFDAFFGSSDNSDGFSMEDLFSDNPVENPGNFGSNLGTMDSVFGGTPNGLMNDQSFGTFSAGTNNLFGSNPMQYGNNSFGFNGFQQSNNLQQNNNDYCDKLIDGLLETTQTTFEILIEVAKSIKLRTIDDIAFLSTNLIKTGLILIALFILVGLVGNTINIKILSFSGITLHAIFSGALLLTTGITGIGASAFVLTKIGRKNIGGIGDIEDIPNDNDNFTDDYESNIGDELDDLLAEELDSLLEDYTDTDDDKDNDCRDEIFEPNTDRIEDMPLDFTHSLDNIKENQYINRETLFNVFKDLFPKCTPQFADKKEIEKTSQEFMDLEAICFRALSNIANVELEEINSYLESATDSFFSYELKLKRYNKVKKLEELEKELEAYLKDGSDDDKTATVELAGDFYKILITKGKSAIVTFGDVFKQDYCREFFLNNKNKLPIITGVDELGNVILEDAKLFDTMLIAGKPRSGKSWYMLSILMSLMLFNSPEQVQFCIIDPKESNLFKTISLMPHVCGLHTDKHILAILNDIIEVEAPRRAKLLEDNRVDDIWQLWKKGIMLPVLYVVIDEYITVINNLDSDGKKELNAKIQTLISRLPSQGIRLLFVPHRATGVVDKTNRTMLQFTAAVRANNDDVVDTLGIKKWSHSLTNQGDIAVKSSTMKSAKYVRGLALTTDDIDNTSFIETAAKIFYKMGVELPDMSTIRIAANRNENSVMRQLGLSSSRKIQYDASTILDDIESLDLNNI